jgi:cytochrome P450
LKNPIYLKLSEWGFLDATFPVAKFARARMAERLPELDNKNLTATEKREKEKEPLLPMSEKPPVKSPDLLSKFLAAREARPEFMTDTLVQTMAVSMAFAGSETTAISLSAVFYYLLKNPRTLERLRQEIDEAAREGRFSDYETGLVTWHESQTLPYLDACVKEAFRLHPAPGLPMERIVPKGGLDIAGRYVKGGTIVGVSAWVVHRDEKIFGEKVDEFRPERWLTGGEEVKAMNGTMLQFGMGSRTCIGKNISLLEIYKLVPTMLRRFEVCRLRSLGFPLGSTVQY